MGNGRKRRKCTTKATLSCELEVKHKKQRPSKRTPTQKKVSRPTVKTVKGHARTSSTNNDATKEVLNDCESVEAQALLAESPATKYGCKTNKSKVNPGSELQDVKLGATENFEDTNEPEENTNMKNRITEEHQTPKPMHSSGNVKLKNQTQSPDSGIVANGNSSESEWEEVQERNSVTELDDYNPEIPKEGVEITIDTTNTWLRRRCQRKEIDLMDIIQRQVNRFKKDVQISLHKVHLLCLLAHGRFLNSVLLQQDLLALMLSLVPLELHKPKSLTLETIDKLVVWFCEQFHYRDKDHDLEIKLEDGLKKSIEDCQVNSPRDFNMLFVLMLRSLGFEARLCLSLHPLSFKPDKPLNKTKKRSKIKKDTSNKKPKLDEQNTSSSAVKQEANNSSSSGEKTVIKRPIKKRAAKSAKNKSKIIMSSDSENRTSSDDDFQVSSHKPKKHCKSKISKESSGNDSVTDDSESDFIITKIKQTGEKRFPVPDVNTSVVKTKKKLPNRKILSSDSDEAYKNTKVGIDYWAEVYAKEDGKFKWICVDCVKRNIGDPFKIEEHSLQPITYVLAYDNDNCIKDVTKRYASKWMTHTRKMRIDEVWWEESLRSFLSKKHRRNKNEDAGLEEVMANMPLPTTIGQFKDHPLYALKRHLLKFQAIYPPDAPPLGYIRKEAVYARECVHTLHSRETWLRQARVVRIGEEPYKIVKARPKWNRTTGEIQTDLPLEIFGRWQTEEYVPPVAENGKVPRNEYGNVELFQPSMLPVGTVHLQIPGLNRVARKLDIDCCPALVGFDGNWGNAHPVFDGWIVCEEFKDVLIAAWEEDQVNQQKREDEKREKRIYGNWKRLIKGLLIREKLKKKYDSKSSC